MAVKLIEKFTKTEVVQPKPPEKPPKPKIAELTPYAKNVLARADSNTVMGLLENIYPEKFVKGGEFSPDENPSTILDKLYGKALNQPDIFIKEIQSKGRNENTLALLDAFGVSDEAKDEILPVSAAVTAPTPAPQFRQKKEVPLSRMPFQKELEELAKLSPFRQIGQISQIIQTFATTPTVLAGLTPSEIVGIGTMAYGTYELATAGWNMFLRASLVRNLNSWSKSAGIEIPEETKNTFINQAMANLSKKYLSQQAIKTIFNPTKAGFQATPQTVNQAETEVLALVQREAPLMSRGTVSGALAFGGKAFKPILTPEVWNATPVAQRVINATSVGLEGKVGSKPFEQLTPEEITALAKVVVPPEVPAVPTKPAQVIPEVTKPISQYDLSRTARKADIQGIRQEGTLAGYNLESQQEWLGKGTRYAISVPKDGKLTIYRATPTGEAISAGDYVTTSKLYAEEHIRVNLGGKGKITSIQGILDDLAPADAPNEFWYVPKQAIPKAPVIPEVTKEAVADLVVSKGKFYEPLRIWAIKQPSRTSAIKYAEVNNIPYAFQWQGIGTFVSHQEPPSIKGILMLRKAEVAIPKAEVGKVTPEVTVGDDLINAFQKYKLENFNQAPLDKVFEEIGGSPKVLAERLFALRQKGLLEVIPARSYTKLSKTGQEISDAYWVALGGRKPGALPKNWSNLAIRKPEIRAIPKAEAVTPEVTGRKFIGVTKVTEVTQARSAPWRVAYEYKGEEHAGHFSSREKAVAWAKEKLGVDLDPKTLKLISPEVKPLEVALPKAEAGMPEAGLQPSMLPEVTAKEVFPKGKGVVTQISMQDQLKLQQARQAVVEEAKIAAEEAPEDVRGAYEAQATIEGLKYTHETDPVAQYTIPIQQTRKTKQPDGTYKLTQYTRRVGLDFFISIKEGEFPEYLTVKQAQMIDPLGDFSKWTQKGLKTYNKVPRDVVLDRFASELGFTGTDAVEQLANRVNQIRRENQQIRALGDYIQTGSKEIFPGITAVEPIPEVIGAEEVIPPTIPPVQPPQTVDIPEVPPSPDARNRIITQSEEVIKQSLPGALNRLIQKIPGIGQAMRFERPALIAFAKNNQHLVVAQVAEVAARSDVAARQVATRLPLFKQLHDAFGEKVLRGEKSDIEFIGTEEQAKSPITGTLLDIAQNPELYKLTPTQKNALEAINEHNDASLNYVVNQYGAEIGRFAPKEDGAFLSNVDIDEGIIDWLGSETRAVAQGRGKTRYWQTARDRMVADKTFKPEMDIKRLIEGMDSFKASTAGGISFREAVAGKTRLEVIQETHPKLYDTMDGLRKQLQKLQGYKKILTQQQLTAIDDFLSSPHEEADIVALDDAFFLQAGRYVAKARAGEMLVTIEEQIQAVKDQIRELRPAWKVANLKPYVFVQEGLYRYFPAEQAKYIIQSRKTTSNPMLNFIERWRGQAFSGDFSPFAIQGSIGVLADPLGSLQATAGGVKAAFENRDFTHSFTVDGLIDDINSDIEGWAEFASLMGRTLTGTPREYAAGFLSSIPGFDKFTETTYITVTRGTKNLYDRTWQGLVKSGVPELEAKVAAIEQAQKVYPLVNPAKLGQSQARAALLRAIPTSYSFIRQPVTLIGQASMGFAKTATFQKTTPQERLAMRLIATMAASILVVSATSAAISAWKQGKDDDEIWQAVLDAINPDPNNGKFASIIIGEFRIPLGGPYRAIFRAIYPQEVKGIPFPVPFAGIPNYVFNRITPAIKTQITLLRNKDYYNKQVYKGQFPENIIRALLYEIEGALPLSLGELMGGIRREEFPEEIWQQAAAQFVGVNLIKLDNTYFHKLVRNLGLPTQETPSPYSLERQDFQTNDLYGKVTSVLSDETLEDIKKRKGYPKLVAVIIETRDIKREVDLLPNYSPVSLNADPAKDTGLTYKVLYQQWSDRQTLVLAGDDAEWTTQELVGGKYKTITYKGDKALKAFDKQYPQAEQGNMSQRQFALLNEYWAITDKKKQSQFLKDHPELSVNPRTDYLKTHPKENAQLAVWGQAKLLTKEAYNQFLGLVKSLDIPDSAIPEMSMPPEGSVDNYFKYQDMVAQGTHGSWEADLMLAKDPDLLKFLKLKPTTTPIASLELKVKNRANFDKLDAFSDKDSPDYIADEKARAGAVKKFKTDNPGFVDDTRRIDAIEKGTDDNPISDTIIKNHVDYGRIQDKEGVGSSSAESMLYRVDNPEYDKFRIDQNIWGNNALKPIDQTRIPIWRIDVKYRAEDLAYNNLPTGTAIERAARIDFLNQNESYRIARRQRDFYNLNTPLVTNLVLRDKYVGFYESSDKGFVKEHYLLDNPDLEAILTDPAIMGNNVRDKVDPTKVPDKRYDEIYTQFQPLFDEWDSYGLGTSPNYIANPDDRAKVRDTLLTRNPDFKKARWEQDAYLLFIGQEHLVPDYLGYKDITDKGKPAGQDYWFENDWFLLDHPEFYKAMVDKQAMAEKDFSRVPTREIFQLYLIYDAIIGSPGISRAEARKAFRRRHPEFDAWLVIIGAVSKPIEESDALAGMTEAGRIGMTLAEKRAEIDRLRAEIDKKLKAMKP